MLLVSKLSCVFEMQFVKTCSILTVCLLMLCICMSWNKCITCFVFRYIAYQCIVCSNLLYAYYWIINLCLSVYCVDLVVICLLFHACFWYYLFISMFVWCLKWVCYCIFVNACVIEILMSCFLINCMYCSKVY